MRQGRAKKYLLWLVLLALTMLMPLVMLLWLGKYVEARELQYWAYFSMGLSCATLVMGTIAGYWISGSFENKLPRWLIASVIYGFIGFALAPYLAMYVDTLPEKKSLYFSFYLPAAAAGVFILNVLVIFLLHYWVAKEKLGMTFFRSLVVSAVFAIWMFEAFTHLSDKLYITTSAVAALTMVPVAMSAEVLMDRRARGMVEKLKNICS